MILGFSRLSVGNGTGAVVGYLLVIYWGCCRLYILLSHQLSLVIVMTTSIYIYMYQRNKTEEKKEEVKPHGQALAKRTCR